MIIPLNITRNANEHIYKVGCRNSNVLNVWLSGGEMIILSLYVDKCSHLATVNSIANLLLVSLHKWRYIMGLSSETIRQEVAL